MPYITKEVLGRTLGPMYMTPLTDDIKMQKHKDSRKDLTETTRIKQ